MKYPQTDRREQPTLFEAERNTPPKPTHIPLYKISLVREGHMACYAPQIRSSADTRAIFHSVLADVDREHFVVLFLNHKHRVIGLHTVSIGSLTASLVHPRETFKAAILANAAAIATRRKKIVPSPLDSLQRGTC